MSFDDEPDEDYDDDRDAEEPDEDWDDNWHWYDDPPAYVKEEPDCGACNDGGCRSCEPTRLDVLRSELRLRLRLLRDKLSWRRHEVPIDDPWAPAALAAPPASSGGFTDEPPF